MSRKIARQPRAQVIAVAAQDERRQFWQENRSLAYALGVCFVSWLTIVLYNQWLF